MVHDRSLRLPATRLSSRGTLPLEQTPLAIPGNLPSDPFTLAGRRCAIAGTEGHGAEALWIHPIRAISGFRIAGAAPVDATVTPLGVIRRFHIGATTVVERIATPRDAPGAVWEWVVEHGADPVALRVAWTADLRTAGREPEGGVRGLRWNSDDRSLVVRAGATHDIVLYLLSAPADAWACTDTSVGRAPRLDCAFTATVRAGQPLRFVVAASTTGADDAFTALGRLADPVNAVRARSAALQRLAALNLTIETPEARVGQAVEWAKSRLASYLVHSPGVGTSLVAGYGPSDGGEGGSPPGCTRYSTEDAVRTALASLATGDHDASAAVLRFLIAHQHDSGRIPSECNLGGAVRYDGSRSTPLFLLLVARYHAWTADLALLAEAHPAVRRAFDFCVTTGAADDGRVGSGLADGTGILDLACRELARAAGDIGDRAFAAELTLHASDTDAESVGRADRGNRQSDNIFHDYGYVEFAAGNTEAGFRAWRAALQQGFEGAKGAWPQAPGYDEAGGGRACPDSAASTAALVSGLVYGMLGAAPDAYRNRLRLRPQIPGAWESFTARNIRTGNSDLMLEYTRERRWCTFRVRQTGGGVPITLILETAVPGPRLRSATVNGQPASLDARRFGERLLVPVQLVLDDERTVALELDG